MINFESYNFEGKRVLVRVDFNVPLDKTSFAILDDTRIQGAKATIEKILKDGGSVILMSHLGRPKEGPEDKYSLRHLITYLKDNFYPHDILFANDCIGEEAYELSTNLQKGQILLLENLRFYKEEEKGDETFAQKIAKHGDIYINDAFGTAHRAHASTATIAQFFAPDAKGFGYLMAAEIENGEKVLHGAVSPVVAIVGGAKVSDKIVLLEKLVETSDHILIGGGMAYTFLKALGGEIGSSLCETDYLDLAIRILEKAKGRGCSIHLPEDSVTAEKFAADAEPIIFDSMAIPSDRMGLDIGPKAVTAYRGIILKSKTILWNGPMGVFEFDSFSNGTMSVAKSVAEATKLGAFSLIGGGDSVSAINKAGLESDVSYVSTGGGAMLEFLEGKELPGIAAVKA